jgi:hypothetical protein
LPDFKNTNVTAVFFWIAAGIPQFSVATKYSGVGDEKYQTID